VSAFVILALGLGLGLGLTLGGGNDAEGDLSNAAPLAPPPADLQIWKPSVNATWQIVLLKPLALAPDANSVEPDVDVYDIDLFINPKSTVDALHRLGKRVVCYFSGGSYEPNRPDSKSFKDSDKGKGLEGWPGERWLNLNSEGVRQIMAKRIQLAAQKGCDAIDPDNVDGFDNKNGLGLTQADSIRFMSYLVQQAQKHNMAIGLKNAAKIIPSVLPAMQFSVNEQCVQYADCRSFAPFVEAGKPVFHIEYPSEVKPDFAANFCNKDFKPAQGSDGFSTVIKNMNLDGWVVYCNGQTARTPLAD
ncbi:hypothetical protein EJ06DRAFT_462807, partial [Trichodelitschia bisporula]